MVTAAALTVGGGLLTGCSEQRASSKEEASNMAYVRAVEDFQKADHKGRYRQQFLDDDAYLEQIGDDATWWKKGSDCLSGTIYDTEAGAELSTEDDILIVTPNRHGETILYFTGITHADTVLIPVPEKGVEEILEKFNCPDASDVREVASYDHHLLVIDPRDE